MALEAEVVAETAGVDADGTSAGDSAVVAAAVVVVVAAADKKLHMPQGASGSTRCIHGCTAPKLPHHSPDAAAVAAVAAPALEEVEQTVCMRAKGTVQSAAR